MRAARSESLSHTVTVHDTPDGRTFGVECSCGWRDVCFFGDANVEQRIDSHFFREGVERKVILL